MLESHLVVVRHSSVKTAPWHQKRLTDRHVQILRHNPSRRRRKRFRRREATSEGTSGFIVSFFFFFIDGVERGLSSVVNFDRRP